MEDKTLATEMLSELKASNRRWFIAFLVTLFIILAETCVFVWYISLPVEEVTVEQSTDGDTNSIVGIGDLNVNDTEGDPQT